MSHDPGSIHVPVNSKRVPYRVEAVDNPRYIRIRQSGPDLIVLVPPGTRAHDHRDFLLAAMRASVRGDAKDRSKDWMLKLLLFLVIPAALLGLAMSVSSIGMPAIFVPTIRLALVSAVVLYYLLLLTPRLGLADALLYSAYPSRPEHLLRRLSQEAGVRYLTERTFSGTHSLVTLRRAVLDDPASVGDGIWTTLWILAGGGPLYSSAFSALRAQAGEFEKAAVEATAQSFRDEHLVTRQDFEAASSADGAHPERMSAGSRLAPSA